MTDQTPPPYPVAPPPPPEAAYLPPIPAGAPIGKVRSTGICILLTIVTIGIYSLYWWYQTHEELKRHSGQGLGGLVALLLAIFITPVTAFFTSEEIGKLYRARGQEPPVTAMTGLWYFPGVILVVLPIVWFVKTNAAINNYWRSLGAEG